MKILLTLLIVLQVSLLANTAYYQHRVSQFELLSFENSKSIVMLGDSITDRGLWNELTKRNDIINRGISGDTTIGVLGRLDSLNKNLKIAFVMIGVNDLLKNRSVEYVFKNYVKIISGLEEKGIKPIIQTTLHVGTLAPAIYNTKIYKLNELLKNYAQKEKLQFIDLNKVFAPNEVLLDKYSLDGLHLNGAGYMEWVKIIIPYM
ncbi:MAG: lipolytic protein [Epsilonproteobacteria bacterium]|nr:MAG: lipolytic protein [Campylobacterota bacterium]